MKHLCITLAMLVGCASREVATSETVQAVDIVSNGSFETGNYTGWTLLEPGSVTGGTYGIASDGETIQAGAFVFDFADNVSNQQTSPGLPITYDATDGMFVALHLQREVQDHRMFQTITLPACQPLLQWDMVYRSHGAFELSNQFTAVNIRDTNDAILATPFKTIPGDPLVLPGMTPFQVDLSAFSAQTVRVDFEHIVRSFHFDIAWDHIRVICKGLSASPGTLDFGTVAVGATSTRTTTVTNFAATPLTISSAIASPFFVISNGPPLPLTIQPGGTTTFELAYQPIAIGPADGTFTLNSDDPNGATVVALTGFAVDGATLAASPSSVAFGPVQVGETSDPAVVDLQNTGTSDLTITAASVGPQFTIVMPALPITLAPGTSTTVTVRFAPTSPGLANDAISIVSNDPGTPTLVPLIGDGVEPRLTASPPSLVFGNQRTGTASPPQVVGVRNDGIGPVTITDATLTGPFTRGALALPVTLAPGSVVDVSVTFSPNVPGPANGQLIFTSNAATLSVPLTGTGVEPLIAVNPTNVNFGDQRVGTTGLRTIVVSNPGNDQLVINALTISGSPVFATTNPVPIVIAPGGNTTLTVQFTPSGAATFNGTLTISSNATPGAPPVTLSGRGVEPLVAVDPASLAFGNRRVGTTSGTKNVVVTNTGTSALTVAFIGIDPPFTASSPAVPFVLAPGAAATIQVAFAPSVAGSVTRDLVIMTDAALNTKLVPCTGTGTEPVINASTASLAFGNVRTGTTSAGQTVTVSNVGTAPLTITAATAPAQFTIASPTLPRSVLPGASLTFTVKFAPTADGPANGSVVITSDAAGSPTQVAVTGTGVSPEIAVTPASHDFGNVRVGSTSAPAGISIQNPGTEPLTVTGLTLAAPFARTTVALPATISPGASLAFDVTFSPTARAASVGTLTITSDAGAVAVGITGRGIAPLIAASLDPVDFGSVAIASTSSLLLQLSNSGDAPLAISALAFAGSNAGDFALTSAPVLPAIVAPGGSLTVSIDFTPGDHGARTAQLVATSDALGNPTLAVGLAGAGAGPRVALTPPDLDFGAANVTSTTAPKTVAISNTGETDLVVSSIVLGGANAADFAVTATLPVTLPPGASSSVTFTFTPSAVGARAASATIVTTDPLVPTAVVTLAGAGESPELAVSPASLLFGDLRVGQSKALPFTITNTGTGPLTITTLALSGADTAEFALETIAVPLVLAPSASRTVTVTFSPTVLGSASATLDVLSDDPVTGTVAAPLTGAGVSPSVALSPGDLDFGGQLVGRLSAPRQLRIQNTGTGPLAVTSLAIAGAQSSSFTLVSPPALPATIAANAELVLSLRVTPAMIGAHAADLVIGTDSPDAPSASAGLAALGISTALTLTPTMIDFGTTRVATQSAPVAVTLTNLTGDTLTLVDPVLGGARPGDFTVTSIAGTLASGASVTAMVSHTATVAGTSAATLTFRTTDPAIPQAIVTLAGKAVSTFVTADRGELAFGQIQLGDRSGPKSITLTNVTLAPVTIASVVAGDDQFLVDASAATVAIPPGGNATFTVTFEPSADALISSQIVVTLAGSTEPELAISVTGEGTSPSSGGCSTTPGSSAALLLALVVLLRRRARPSATARS
jgi:hypothetical protein